MKKLIGLFILIIAFAQNAVSFADTQIYTMPLFITGLNAQNTWDFETASEIATNEIINYVAQTKGISTPKLQTVNIAHSKDTLLAQTSKKWSSTQILDVNKFSQIEPTQDKILIVACGVVDKKGKILDPWDVLSFNIDFNIGGNFDIITKVFLLDNKDGVLLWEKNYSYTVNTKRFSDSKKYEFALDEREKFRSYARNIIARDAIENLANRLNPKSINYASKVQKTETQEEGIGLKHSRNNRLPHVKITPPSQTMEERLLNDDSFEL